jgi:hypothetical protein
MRCHQASHAAFKIFKVPPLSHPNQSDRLHPQTPPTTHPTQTPQPSSSPLSSHTPHPPRNDAPHKTHAPQGSTQAKTQATPPTPPHCPHTPRPMTRRNTTATPPERVNRPLQVAPHHPMRHPLPPLAPARCPTPTHLTQPPHPPLIPKPHPLPKRPQRRAKPPLFPCACHARAAPTASGRSTSRRNPNGSNTRRLGRSQSQTPRSPHHRLANRPKAVRGGVRHQARRLVKRGRAHCLLPPIGGRVSSSSLLGRYPTSPFWRVRVESSSVVCFSSPRRFRLRIGVPAVYTECDGSRPYLRTVVL